MRTNKPDRPPLELDDYAGRFQPDLHLSDFSKEGPMKRVEIGGVNDEAGKYSKRGHA